MFILIMVKRYVRRSAAVCVTVFAMSAICAVAGFSAFLLLFVIPAPAWGQAASATDNELYAAYCIGVIRAAEEAPHQPAADPEVERRLSQTGAAMRQQALQRFQSYLAATGALTDNSRANSIFGLTNAMRRGQDDAEQARRTMNGCNVSVYGDGKHTPIDGHVAAMQRFLSCTAQDQSVSREMRCLGPDNLPF